MPSPLPRTLLCTLNSLAPLHCHCVVAVNATSQELRCTQTQAHTRTHSRTHTQPPYTLPIPHTPRSPSRCILHPFPLFHLWAYCVCTRRHSTVSPPTTAPALQSPRRVADWRQDRAMPFCVRVCACVRLCVCVHETQKRINAWQQRACDTGQHDKAHSRVCAFVCVRVCLGVSVPARLPVLRSGGSSLLPPLVLSPASHQKTYVEVNARHRRVYPPSLLAFRATCAFLLFFVSPPSASTSFFSSLCADWLCM